MNDAEQGNTVPTHQFDQHYTEPLSDGAQEPFVQEQLRLAGLMRDVSLALIQSTGLQEMVQQCTEALVHHFAAAFARIWTLNAETQVLELQASAGMYTHLDGSHSRVPVGTLKIGLIASERLPHLTNAVVGDPRVSDQAWAVQEGMVAFAGYPLISSERLVGVMALFAHYPLSPSVLDAMASVANTIAVGIDRKQGEQERIRLLMVERQARQTAEAAQERLTSVLNQLTDGFMIFDNEWRYSYINPQAEPFAGKPREELLGKVVWEEFPHLIDSLFYQQYHHAVKAQEAVAFQVFSSLLGQWFDIRAYPIADGLVVYFRLVTEQVLAAQERERLLQAEQQARTEAEAALSVRTSFLSSVSHDLKTPLASIKANVQLVQRRLKREQGDAGSWFIERLTAAEKAITKMIGMIDDLLDLARQQSGQPDEVFSPLDLMTIIQQVVAEQQATTKRHHLLLTSECEHLPMRGSAARLDRAMTNLLGNAIKYSPQGGEITIVVTQEEQEASSWVSVCITDSGIGIPAADLPHIFEPFYRAGDVANRIQGTGIGLASVAQVIEQHQGTITATSCEGEGSSFTVRLPLVAGTATLGV